MQATVVASGRARLLAWLPPIALVGLLVGVAVGDIDVSVDASALVLQLPLAFVVPVSFAIALLASRGYLATGDPGLVWLGGGAFFWATAWVVATLLARHDLNAAVTAHNLLAWLSAASHLCGVLMPLRQRPLQEPAAWPLVAAFALAAVVVAMVGLAAWANLTPVFFVSGQGGTMIRQLVLGSALLMFACSAALLLRDDHDEARAFPYLYGLALLLISTGLAALMMEATLRNAMAWIGRIAQVTGTAYMLAAIVVTARELRRLRVPVTIALREAEQRFDDLVDMVGDGILVHALATPSEPGRFLHVNPAACSLLGYTPEALARLSLTDLVAAEDRPVMARQTSVLAERRRLTHERTLVTRDGRRIAAELNSRVFRRGAQDFVVSTLRDISERRRIEEERAHLAAIVQYSHDAIVAEALDGTITDWNQGASELFGYTAAEAIGKPVAMLFPPDRIEAELTMRDALGRGEALRDLETVRLHKSGRALQVSVTISPILDSAGKVVGISKIARDITTKKRAEATMARATAAAEEANRAKSSFLANMSHEIRTPLHNIVGLAELLRRDAVDPIQRQRLDALCTTSEHMLSIINDILELSRIEAGRLTLDDQDFVLSTVLDGVVAVIGGPARAKGLELGVEVDDDLRDLVLCGDPTRLGQVLINLASNAVRFTREGRVSIRVEAVARWSASVRLRFSIRDSGIGIAVEDRARIFRAFEQVGDAGSRVREGTGLGLAISEGLVTAMGGRIDVDSTPGVGSTFAFDLSLALGVGPPLPGPDPVVDAGTFRGSHVLVAEDNALSRDLLRETLADLGCTVDAVGDGEEAVARAGTVVYDLILLDIQMPRLDGLGASRAIRELPEHRHTPILAITANAFFEDRQRCIAAGMNGHLRKPVTRAVLGAELSNWLARVPEAEDAGGPAYLSGARASVAGARGEGMLAGGIAGDLSGEDVLRRFVELHRGDVAALAESVRQGCHETAQRLAHTLEGSAAMIGAPSFAAAAATLSVALRVRVDAARCETLANACRLEFDRLAAMVDASPRASDREPGRRPGIGRIDQCAAADDLRRNAADAG